MVTVLFIPTSVHLLKSLPDHDFTFCRNTLTQIISLENVTSMISFLYFILFSEILKKNTSLKEKQYYKYRLLRLYSQFFKSR